MVVRDAAPGGGSWSGRGAACTEPLWHPTPVTLFLPNPLLGHLEMLLPASLEATPRAPCSPRGPSPVAAGLVALKTSMFPSQQLCTRWVPPLVLRTVLSPPLPTTSRTAPRERVWIDHPRHPI